jgi:hypothetical protein
VHYQIKIRPIIHNHGWGACWARYQFYPKKDGIKGRYFALTVALDAITHLANPPRDIYAPSVSPPALITFLRCFCRHLLQRVEFGSVLAGRYFFAQALHVFSRQGRHVAHLDALNKSLHFAH